MSSIICHKHTYIGPNACPKCEAERCEHFHRQPGFFTLTVKMTDNVLSGREIQTTKAIPKEEFFKANQKHEHMLRRALEVCADEMVRGFVELMNTPDEDMHRTLKRQNRG